MAAASFFVMGLLWTYLFGKDLNSDFRNYHLYSGAQLWHWRLDQDYFPAAVSSYLNPLPNLPTYGMVMAGWNDFLVACVLMCMHLPSLLITWKLARLVIPGQGRMAFGACYAATLLAFLGPMQLTTLSNSFADPIAGIFSLWGLYVLLRSLKEGKAASFTWAGALFGVGAGLKLTNLLLIPAGALLVFGAMQVVKSQPWRSALRYSVGVALGFLMTNGWWAYVLWQKFGNPIFPLYNAIFRSPDFLTKNFADARMLHDGHWSWATLPFTMLSSRQMAYAENAAPDIRLLCALVVFGVVAALLVWRWLRSRVAPAPHSTQEVELSEARRLLWAMMAYFAVAYLTWGVLSGIGRYAYVLWMLLGPIFIGLLSLYATAPVLRVLATLVITAQLVVQFFNPWLPWSPAKWGGEWVNLRVPPVLRDQPASYILYGSQSNAFIVPYLHPSSRVSNVIGQYIQPVGDRMHEQFRTWLSQPTGPLRVIASVQNPGNLTELSPTAKASIDALFSGYGFKVKAGACHRIELMGEALPKNVEGTWQLAWAERKADLGRVADTFMVCDLSPLSPEDHQSALAGYKKVDQVFDAVERACGKVLSPHGVQTFNSGDAWHRMYFNSLMVLSARGDEVSVHPNETMLTIPIGKRSEIERGKVPDCPDIRNIMRTTRIQVHRAEP